LKNLRASVKREGFGAIHFAGEALHLHYKGYLQAAFFSGMEEAEEIARANSNC